jgi:hypothetical protein
MGIEKKGLVLRGSVVLNTWFIGLPSSIMSYNHLVVMVVPLQSLVLGVVGMVGVVVLVARVLGSCK